jgi:hypothetical protein
VKSWCDEQAGHNVSHGVDDKLVTMSAMVSTGWSCISVEAPITMSAMV